MSTAESPNRLGIFIGGPVKTWPCVLTKSSPSFVGSMQQKEVDIPENRDGVVVGVNSQKEEVDIKMQDASKEDIKSHFSLTLLELVHNMRFQNGLRRHDYLAYHKYCTKRSRGLRKQLHLTCARGRYSRQTFMTNTSNLRYIHLLVFNVERCWSYGLFLKSLLDSRSSRPLKSNRLRHYMHRRFRKASIYAKHLLKLAELYAERHTLLEVKAYVSYHEGFFFIELRRWEEAAKKLLVAQQCTLQLQHLTLVSGSYYEAVSAQVKSVEALLSTATHYLKRQNISIEVLLPEKCQDNLAPIVSENCVPIYWRGVLVSVTQSLLNFSQYNEIQRFLSTDLDPFLDNLVACTGSVDSHLWSSLLEKYSFLEDRLEKSSGCVREYLVDTNIGHPPHMLFVSESLLRDWSKIIAIELHCFLIYIMLSAYCAQEGAYCIQAFQKRDQAQYPAALLYTLADIVLQVIASFEKEIASGWFPAPLETSLHEKQPFLLSRFSLWTRVIRDVRALSVCMTCGKTLKKKEEAYVLLRRLIEKRQEFVVSVTDLSFPKDASWSDSPFSRVSRVVLLLDQLLNPCLRTVDILFSADLAIAQYSTDLESSSLQDSLQKLQKFLPNLLDEPQLKPIPMKPIFLDLVSCSIEEPQSYQSVFSTAQQSLTGFVGRFAFWRRK